MRQIFPVALMLAGLLGCSGSSRDPADSARLSAPLPIAEACIALANHGRTLGAAHVRVADTVIASQGTMPDERGCIVQISGLPSGSLSTAFQEFASGRGDWAWHWFEGTETYGLGTPGAHCEVSYPVDARLPENTVPPPRPIAEFNLLCYPQ